MSIENFIYYNIIMLTFTWFLHYRHGIDEYDNGFLDAIQLHSEGRLIYTIENIGDDENVLTIEVYEDEN